MFTTPGYSTPACASLGERRPPTRARDWACMADGHYLCFPGTLIQNLVPTADYYPDKVGCGYTLTPLSHQALMMESVSDRTLCVVPFLLSAPLFIPSPELAVQGVELLSSSINVDQSPLDKTATVRILAPSSCNFSGFGDRDVPPPFPL
ncbi:unnamed protein product [Lota lota]